jgi:predicted methyltransferase
MLKFKSKSTFTAAIAAVSVCATLTIASFSITAHASHGNEALIKVVSARDAEQQARDKYRNPVETLSFFRVEPGMKVAEALPGGGWYSKILGDYLGEQGALHGINYNDDMWAMFGFFTEERIKEMSSRTAKFPALVAELSDSGIASSGFTFATAPKAAYGTLDRVLFVRALHNLNRFEEQAGTRTQALQVAFDLLKDDGLVGVVQHRISDSNNDAYSDGSRGYLKQSEVIAAFEQAGFELMMTSEVNANDKDRPVEGDIVWRLPPSLNGVGDDEQKRKAMLAIGESDRMTLLFKKKGANVAY